MPYENVESSISANGGAYPPDMSVLVKARTGGANYIYSIEGYEDPPANIELDDGVYYNKFMPWKQDKNVSAIMDGLVEYIDGTKQPKIKWLET